MLGCFMHIFSCMIIILYVNNSYIEESENQIVYACLLAVGIIYPSIYDFSQMFKLGPDEYFQEFWNFVDIMYILGMFFNIGLQILLGPFSLYSRISMCVIVLALLVKTFFFLRIFPTLTPIVVMLSEVIYDLRVFLLFYVILISFFSQIFAVLGLGNDYDKKYTGDSFVDPKGAAQEYKSIGLHLGEFFWTFRMSLGDFSAIGAIKSLSKIDNQIFWLMWIWTVIVTCIIFLNFVVCEACASYARIKEIMEQVQI